MRVAFRTRPLREPDLTGLINVVFLILIFFIVAGTLRPFSEPDVKLAELSNADTAARSAIQLIVKSDGTILHRGEIVQTEHLRARLGLGNEKQLGVFTIVADARLDAGKALEIISVVRSAHHGEIRLLTRRPRS